MIVIVYPYKNKPWQHCVLSTYSLLPAPTPQITLCVSVWVCFDILLLLPHQLSFWSDTNGSICSRQKTQQTSAISSPRLAGDVHQFAVFNGKLRFKKRKGKKRCSKRAIRGQNERTDTTHPPGCMSNARYYHDGVYQRRRGDVEYRYCHKFPIKYFSFSKLPPSSGFLL